MSLLGPGIPAEESSVLDLPSWYRIGDVGNWRSNPWQCLKINCEGQQATFYLHKMPRAGTTHRIDPQAPIGKVGGKIGKRGVKPEPVELVLLIWERKDEDLWDRYVHYVDPKLRGTKHTIAQIGHPSFNRYRTTAIFIHDVHEQLNADVNGALSVYINGIETIYAGSDKDGRGKAKVASFEIQQPNALEGGEKPLPTVLNAVPNPAADEDLP